MKNAFFIVGPTASGKSDLAATVAERIGAEIIGADAFQIYRGFPLLTALPNESTMRRAPHHLLGTLSLSEEMSAQKYRKEALSTLAKIQARGGRALIVGGSGLYVKALTHGLATLPAVDAQLREQLNALSLAKLTVRLAEVDPTSARTIDPKNKRRLVRALEIFAQTQTPASALRDDWQAAASPVAGVFIFRERAELYARIDRRVEEMFREGVVEEVRAVQELSTTASKALGLAQIRQLLAGDISEKDCVAAIQQATRRYAKRQLTWFRQQHNFPHLNLSSLKDHEAAVDWILQKAERSFAPAE